MLVISLTRRKEVARPKEGKKGICTLPRVFRFVEGREEHPKPNLLVTSCNAWCWPLATCCGKGGGFGLPNIFLPQSGLVSLGPGDLGGLKTGLGISFDNDIGKA